MVQVGLAVTGAVTAVSLIETKTVLPISENASPSDQGDLAAAVRDACARKTAVYPIGGGTSLDYGAAATRPGIGLSLARINRVVDFPARDMTITVEAGITMSALRQTLAAERMRLPVDAPQAERATLGGVIATNTSGPRRYGQGTMRDYVIGISAVDGRGVPFKGGGRVVKNVAGYDFCKLLTGSMGTLGVITQVTLKVKPVSEASAFLLCDLDTAARAEQLLAGIVNSRATPAAVELLCGPMWQSDSVVAAAESGAFGKLAVGLEGTSSEVDWMIQALRDEWQWQGIREARVINDEAAVEVWSRLIEFPVGGLSSTGLQGASESPLVIKASIRPSGMVEFMRLVMSADPACSMQAHAGNGVVVARLSPMPFDAELRMLVEKWRPAAERAGGSAVVLSAAGNGLDRRNVWGTAEPAAAVMESVKRQFDPEGVLNPGRFVYEAA